MEKRYWVVDLDTYEVCQVLGRKLFEEWESMAYREKRKGGRSLIKQETIEGPKGTFFVSTVVIPNNGWQRMHDDSQRRQEWDQGRPPCMFETNAAPTANGKIYFGHGPQVETRSLEEALGTHRNLVARILEGSLAPHNDCDDDDYDGEPPDEDECSDAFESTNV